MMSLLAIAGADAAERMRRFAFLLTVAVALYVGYLYVPDAHAGYGTVIVGGHRGLYTSAFLGAAIAVLTGSFLSMIGFFLIRGSVERDRELNVDGVVCASPVRSAAFLLGKFGSNLVVLLAIAAITLLAAIFMQEIRGEDRHVDLLAYVLPFLAFTVPAMAIIASIAIAFDVVRPLRGVIGGIVYFLAVFPLLLVVPVQTSANLTHAAAFDPLGFTTITSSLRAAANAAYPQQKITDMTIGNTVLPKSGASTFVFHGFAWTPMMLAQRAMWLAIAILLVLAISPFFDRFRREASARKNARFTFDAAWLVPNVPALRLFRAEFALLVNGASIWWILGALALAVVTGVAPLQAVTRFVLPVALIWPLERLSALGSRERRWGVDDILASTRRYASRTLLVQWIAGTLLGMLICAGYIVHLAVLGNIVALAACVAVISATAAAALALGIASGAARTFEMAYLVLWYVGPINALPPLDFAGGMIAAPLVVVSIATVVLIAAFALAAASRWRARTFA